MEKPEPCEDCGRENPQFEVDGAKGKFKLCGKCVSKRCREVDALLLDNICPACAGTGKPESGKLCMCGGSGKASDAVPYLLERLAEFTVDRKEPAEEGGLRDAKDEEIRKLKKSLETCIAAKNEFFTALSKKNSDSGRSVEVYRTEWSKEKRASVHILRGRAKFHCWGIDYQEFDNGPGQFSTAVVEFEDGTVGNIPAELIKFLGE